MFLDFFIPFVALDWGWIVLAISRNLYWLFAIYAAMHFLMPDSKLFPNYIFFWVFNLSFMAWFEIMGIGFSLLCYVFVLQVVAFIFLNKTRFEHHWMSVVIGGVFILGALATLGWM